MQKKWMVSILIFVITGMACSSFPFFGSNPELNDSAIIQDNPTEELPTEDELEEGLPERPEPNPLNVTPILEEGNTTSKMVFPDRETSLSVTAADGTLFMLTIPINAVLSPVEVSMTPVADLEGFPEGADKTLAVNLEPDGLTLMEPATLSIQPASTSEEFTAFTTFSGGKDLHLSPSSNNESSIDIPLMHFSVPGVFAAGEAFLLDMQVSHPPSNTSAYYKEKILEYTTSDFSPDVRQDLIAKAFSDWSRFLRVILHLAAFDATVIDEAIMEYIYYHNWFEVILRSDQVDINDYPGLAAIYYANVRVLADGLVNAFDIITVKCEVEKDPDQAVRLLRYYAVTEKLGLWATDSNGALTRDAVKEMLKDCVDFYLVFESELVGRGNGVFTHKVGSNIALKLDLDRMDEPYTSELLELNFEGTVDYNSFTVTGMSAGCKFNKGDGVVNIKLYLGLNFYDDPPRFDEEVMTLMHFPAEPFELIDCAGGVTPFVMNLWVDFFRILHRADAAGGDGPLLFRLKKTDGQANLYAVYDSNLTLADLAEAIKAAENDPAQQDLSGLGEYGDNLEETSSFRLFHKP